MSEVKAVTGVFEYVDQLLTATNEVKAKEYKFTVYSPALNHEIVHEISPERSHVRFFTGFGAVCGLIAGFTLAIWTSLDYPLRTSAKEIVSIPGFVVCGYEWAILWGGLATLTGMMILCKIPNLVRKVGYHPRFSDDRFGVVVNCPSEEVENLKNSLTKAGAEEVIVSEAL